LKKTTLIIGNGTCSQRIANRLLFQGANVILASEDTKIEFAEPPGAADQLPGCLEVLTATEVLACHGYVGQFEVWLRRSGTKIHRSTATIIIAADYQRKPNFALYDLKPGDYVCPLSLFSNSASGQHRLNNQVISAKKIIFLSGLVEESNPVIHSNIMLTALELQSEFDVQTYILTRNLKVSGDGLEALSRELKKAGGVITKFTNTRPEIRQAENGSVELEYFDEVTLETFRLNPDLTVVDETICPSPYLQRLSHIFDLDTDPIGFLQTANTRRIPVHTNRMGILAAGPSKAIQGFQENIVDADTAALTALEVLSGSLPKTPPSAEIDSGKCVRCLTCLRLCPHHAISFGAELWISSDACQGCGLCVAECPSVAIDQPQLQNDPISDLRLDPSKQSDAGVLSIVAFCCSRSAARAADLARCMDSALPAGLHIVEVPCAGRISMEYIHDAFAGRAEGVLIVSCHDGNCHSEIGTVFARHRTSRIVRFLEHTDASQGRIEIHTLAANMSREFSDIIHRFEKQLSAMGPLYK
jgi:coenzyme F420-reducing hydrogenase delta subunit/NAD-dependent dihydropyrimidine dehydrogenase PreA subunit